MIAAPTRFSCVLVAVALASCKPEEQRVARLPVVRVVSVIAAPRGEARFTGVVRARYESALGFRVAGKVAGRMVDPGDRVRAGQPLMRLDDIDFGLALRASHAAVAAARATATQAASDEARRRVLVKQGWATPQSYEQNKAASDAGAAQLASALAQEKQVGDQASYAVLRADADGVVMEVPADPGQVVGVGQTVVRLAHEGAREAEIYLPEGTEQRARDGASATLYATPLVSFPAILREVSAMADPLTRTYRARYVLGGLGRAAPLGATVTVRLGDTAAKAPTYAVPLGAIFDDGHGSAVWEFKTADRSLTLRSVHIQRIGEEDAFVSGDLRLGTQIVATGVHLLKPGQRVERESPAVETAAR